MGMQRTDDLDQVTFLTNDISVTRLTLTDGRESFDVEIDLSDENFKTLLTAVAMFRDAGRPATVRKTRATNTAHRDTESDAPQIRAWAAANGHTVSDRGAISKAVREAYDAREDA